MLYDITTLGDPGVVYPNASSPGYWYYGVYKPDGNGGYTLDNPFGNPLPKVEGPFDYDLEDGDLVILPVQAFIFITFLSISVLALTSIRRDSVTRWNRYERTMPIKQKTIVLSKYISYILWVLVATVIAVIFTHMLVAVKGHQYFDFGMRDILTIFFVSVAFSLSICSFFYLGLYLIGYQKCDILIMISAILSVCFTAIMIVILNSADITIETGRIIILGVSVVFLLLSYEKISF
ncbi:ABC-2 transporter permease [Syntrophaceticus schinkii]|nr:ABC-2 transporter permease [Syntrophaceticus schinkii]